MKLETVVITPEIAKEMLKKNVKNRPLCKKVVSIYAADMASGRWKLNGETIKINGNVLIDGQHRLQACVTSKTPFVSVVARDVESSAFDTIDRGKGRTPGNIFSIAGVKHASAIAAACSAIHSYLSGMTFVTGNYRASIGRMEEVRAEWPEIDEAADFITKQKFAIKLIHQGIAVALCALMLRSDRHMATAFWSDLNDQTNLFCNVTKLRERLVNNKMAKAKLGRDDLAALIIKAWNATKAGSELKVLRWTRVGPTAEMMPLVD